MPLVLRDRIAAVLYADSGDSRGPLTDTDALEILGKYACKVLDLMSASKQEGRTTSEFRADQGARLRQTPPPSGPSLSPSVKKPSASTDPALSNPDVHVEMEDDSGTVMLNADELQASAPAPSRTAAPDSSQLDPESRKQHEDAKRFARLLVSEIKLYNEAKVQKGRSTRNLYGQLKDDIERSRQLYSERVPDSVRVMTNYFDEELVRILADGDANLMGSSM